MRTISASRMRFILGEIMAARQVVAAARGYRSPPLDLAIEWLLEAAVSDVAVEAAPVAAELAEAA